MCFNNDCYVNTSACVQSAADVNAQVDMLHTHTHTHTHTHIYIYIYTHTRTHAETLTYIVTFNHRYTCIHLTYKQTLRTHTHRHTPTTPSCTNTYTSTHRCVYPGKLKHVYTDIHADIHTRPRTFNMYPSSDAHANADTSTRKDTLSYTRGCPHG